MGILDILSQIKPRPLDERLQDVGTYGQSRGQDLNQQVQAAIQNLQGIAQGGRSMMHGSPADDLLTFVGWKNPLGAPPSIAEKLGSDEFALDLLGATGGMVKAFHGSPHKFGKFSMDKIGTGEGAQAFGHGLYFTDKKAVAEHYMSAGKLSDVGFLLDGKDITRGRGFDSFSEAQGMAIQTATSTGNVKNAIFELQASIDDLGLTKENPYGKNFYDAIDWLKKNEDRITFKKKGNVYKTTLWEGKQENLLDWDKPINLNTENSIKLQLMKEFSDDNPIYKKLVKLFSENDKYKKDLGIYKKLKKELADFVNKNPNYETRPLAEQKRINKIGVDMDKLDDKYGGHINSYYPALRDGVHIYRELSDALGSDRQASAFLKRAGFDGIRYPTSSLSNGGGDGYNYVVFDEADIKIEQFNDLVEKAKKKLK